MPLCLQLKTHIKKIKFLSNWNQATLKKNKQTFGNLNDGSSFFLFIFHPRVILSHPPCPSVTAWLRRPTRPRCQCFAPWDAVSTVTPAPTACARYATRKTCKDNREGDDPAPQVRDGGEEEWSVYRNVRCGCMKTNYTWNDLKMVRDQEHIHLFWVVLFYFFGIWMCWESRSYFKVTLLLCLISFAFVLAHSCFITGRLTWIGCCDCGGRTLGVQYRGCWDPSRRTNEQVRRVAKFVES